MFYAFAINNIYEGKIELPLISLMSDSIIEH